MNGSNKINLMTGGNVTKQQWKEVEKIVQQHQRSLLATFNHKDKLRYQELQPIINELHKYAHCGDII